MLLHGRGCTNESKKKLSILFLLVLAIFPLVSAVQIDSGTIVQSLGLNLTFNFTAQAFADSFTTLSNSIYFENYRRTGTEYITMNLTQRNATYFGTALPYFSSSSTTSKTITSGLTPSINATVIVTVNTCELTASYRGQNIRADSCSGGQAIFILNQIPTGNSVLSLFQAVCQSNERVIFNLVLIFSVLAVLSTTIIFVYNKGGLPEINAKILLVGFLLVTIGIVFVVQIANDSASFCPA